MSEPTIIPQKNVIILRGVPGSGKTTFLRDFFPEFVSISADKFRMIKGKYVFKPEDNLIVHNQCLRTFFLALQKGVKSNIAVDNTNTRVYEIAPYYRLAEVFGYRPIIFQIVCPAEYAAERNKHNVPFAAVKQMEQQMEPLPSFWRQRLITDSMIRYESASFFPNLLQGE